MILAEYEAKDILERAGIPVVSARAVQSLERAVAEAEEMGFPLR